MTAFRTGSDGHLERAFGLSWTGPKLHQDRLACAPDCREQAAETNG
jgi:hypothetical protein